MGQSVQEWDKMPGSASLRRTGIGPAYSDGMKAIKITRSGTNWKGEHIPEMETAILSSKEEFAAHFKNRFGLNKGETRSIELAFTILLGCKLETVEWPQ